MAINKIGHEPKVYSRSDIQSEKDIMDGWASTLKHETKRYIDAVWCDSKACAYYVIELCKTVSNADELALSLHKYLLSIDEGYNAIVVTNEKGDVLCDLPAYW